MSYDSQHNITSKIQNHETATSTSPTAVAGTWTQVEPTSYNLNYQDYNTAEYSVAGYAYKQPHAPRKIVDQPNLAGCCDAANDPRVKTKGFEYDRNGNQTKITSKICTSETPDIERENLWDEENRLRAIDLNPESGTVHPIAIYTYDAGGERVIKQNATSVAVYENALQVGTAIKNDYMLYPSGMLVARPGENGALSYTKHYFAGSQRVSSKIGTTTNLGKFLKNWTLIENSSGGAPINIVSTSHDQLPKAEAAVTKVYTAFVITPTPTLASNTAFLPVEKLEAKDKETETYFFHPDHLGSSNYITNFVGEVSQHMEYFAFGETFIEEHKNSHNSPYKFNGKELDEESGLYYYGARYYDPRISIWASVDPLVEETMDSFGYCYQNPINYFEPDGCSPISILLKMMLKKGAKEGLKAFAEKQIKNKIENYVKKLAKGQYKKLGKELAEDVEKILGDLDEEWWETAIELVPVAGDAYGTTKFGIKLKRAYDKMQDLENKYIGKLHDLLPKTLQEEFKKKARRKGVYDAKVDQKAGARGVGTEYEGEEIYVTAKKGDLENQIEGDHLKRVVDKPALMQDPRNIRFKNNATHKEKTRSENTKGGKRVHSSSRHF